MKSTTLSLILIAVLAFSLGCGSDDPENCFFEKGDVIKIRGTRNSNHVTHLSILNECGTRVSIEMERPMSMRMNAPYKIVIVDVLSDYAYIGKVER